jgi:hypothetical protein
MAHWTLSRFIQIAAALCGAIGTVFLYFGSFAYEAPPVWMNEAILQQMNERNRRRQENERIGLSFLLLSFLLGASSVFVD